MLSMWALRALPAEASTGPCLALCSKIDTAVSTHIGINAVISLPEMSEVVVTNVIWKSTEVSKNLVDVCGGMP